MYYRLFVNRYLSQEPWTLAN